jgi:ATPase subunit of ABC transporter with duplicated ATPase domains
LATLDGYLQLLAMEGQPPQLLERRRLVLARRELLAELFAAAVQATIDRVRAGALAAAYDEVARAWERFSGWAPVRLEAGAKGKLAVHTAARALELAQLSGGERAAFLVLLHAHLGRHFGRGGFLLLDEPLEHLDADSGQRLLELLRRACHEGVLTQVVLATVEAEVVHRALDDTAVHLVRLPSPAAPRSA